MRLSVTVAAFSLCFATCAASETALDMQAACRELSNARADAAGALDIRQDFPNGYCWGAFSVFQHLGSSRMAGDKPVIPVCLPQTFSRLALIKTFMQHMAHHP